MRELNKLIFKDKHQKKFYFMSNDYIKSMLGCKNLKTLLNDFNITRDELSLLMKLADFRIKDIKEERTDWINDIEADATAYRLGRKPTSREIFDKMINYFSICKDFNYLVGVKKILDEVSIKFSVTMFESMTDREEEDYYSNVFNKSDDGIKYENGKMINNFFS